MTISIKPTASGSTIEQDGSTILTVDGSGNITTENNLTVSGRIQSTTQPAFYTAVTTAQNNGGVGAGTHILEFASTDLDTTNSFDTANNKYVVPVDGIYVFNASITWQTTSISYRYIRAWIRKNGSLLSGGHTHISNETSDDDYVHMHITSVVQCSAGDEIDVVWGTGTTSQVRIYYASKNTNFSGYLIG